MKNKIHKSLTIVLKIRDNFEMADRWFDNMVKQSNKFRIIIADGSKKKYPLNKNLNDHLEIEHVKTTYDKDHLTYMRKLEYVIGKKVKTKYTLIADDDDFYIVKKLEDYTNFLLKNPDYVGCGGNILKFELQKFQLDKPIFTNFNKSKQVNLENDNRIDRIRTILNVNTYSEVYYDILKTKVLSKSFSDFININKKNVNYRFVEFYIMVNALSNGKLKRFDNYYLMRQEDYQSSTSAGIINNISSLFFQNWSENYFNLLKYTEKKFELKKNDKLYFEIEEQYKRLFTNFISTEIINSGDFNITFKSLIKTRMKAINIFGNIKNVKRIITIKFFDIFNHNKTKKYKKLISHGYQ